MKYKINNLTIYGDQKQKTIDQMVNVMKNKHAVTGILSADGHFGYGWPVGGVVAYKDHISPTGVGPDIGCGNKIVRLDIPSKEVKNNIVKIMDMIWENISFGVGLKNNEKIDHVLFDDEAWHQKAISPHKELARSQLGTVGSGVCHLV